MRFDVITLFPELFAPFLTQGVTRRAFSAEIMDVQLHQLRDFAQGQYRRVDDRPYGGGPGMVMLAEPLEGCLHHIRSQRQIGAEADFAPLIMFTPTGRPLTHNIIQDYAQSSGAILLCGRYEGVDQRFIDHYVRDELSLGDFVLSGGEIPAMAFLDAVARLQPGVLGDELSSVQDSFNPSHDGLLDYPHYTRPESLRWCDTGVAAEIPEVLLSGNHAKIERWRRDEQLRVTLQKRPELIKKALQCGVLDKKDRAFLKELGYNVEL
ncbi:MAG: tRNA (guanosine(37)-N1)-methyltransferase TrmD [Saezia sp.]